MPRFITFLNSNQAKPFGTGLVVGFVKRFELSRVMPLNLMGGVV